MAAVGLEAHDGQYRFTGSTVVAAGPDEVRRWLVEPDRLVRWVPGADGCEVGADGEVSLRVHIPSRYGGGPSTFRGRTDAGPGGVARSWVLVGPTGASEQYRRDVAYGLDVDPAGTWVAVEVVTHIPGASRRALAAGGRVEARALDGALAELGRAVAGRPAGWARRLVRSAAPAGPL